MIMGPDQLIEGDWRSVQRPQSWVTRSVWTGSPFSGHHLGIIKKSTSERAGVVFNDCEIGLSTVFELAVPRLRIFKT